MLPLPSMPWRIPIMPNQPGKLQPHPSRVSAHIPHAVERSLHVLITTSRAIRRLQAHGQNGSCQLCSRDIPVRQGTALPTASHRRPRSPPVVPSARASPPERRVGSGRSPTNPNSFLGALPARSKYTNIQLPIPESLAASAALYCPLPTPGHTHMREIATGRQIVESTCDQGTEAERNSELM